MNDDGWCELCLAIWLAGMALLVVVAVAAHFGMESPL